MAPPQNVEVENAVKYGAFAPQGWCNKPSQKKFGM